MRSRALVEADLVGWRSRLPRTVLRLWVPLFLAGMVTASAWVNIRTYEAWGGVTAADVEGWSSPVGALVLGATVVLPFLLAAAPGVAIWVVPVVAALDAVDPSLGTVRWWWLGTAVVSGVLVVVDGAGAIRQRVVARGWGVVVVPDLAPAVARRLRAGQVTVGVLVLGTLALALTGAGFWLKDRAATEVFRAEATQSAGTVTAVADDASWADVDVGGRATRVSLPATRREVGETVQLRHSADWSRVELVDDVFDPAGALVWTGGGLLVALVLLAGEGGRHESARRLTTQGGIGVRMRMQPVGGARRSFLDTVRDAYLVDLVACDAPDGGGRVVARLRLSPVQPPLGDDELDADAAFDADAPVVGSGEDDREDDSGSGREGGGEGEDDDWDEDDWDADARDAAWTDTDPTDAQLLALLHDDADDDEHEAGMVPSPAEVRREVLVVGLTHHGGRPLVLDDGWWLAAAAPAGDAVRLGGELAPGQGGRGFWPTWHRIERRWLTLWRRTGAATPWLAVPLVFLAGRWMWSGLEGQWRLGVHVLEWVAAGYGWLYVVRPRLAATRDGIWVRGFFVDRWVPWRRVVRVLADEHGVVVRLAAGAIPVPKPPRASGWLMRHVDDPVVAAQALEVERWTAGPPATAGAAERPSERHRLSPLVVVGLLWGVAFLLPAFL